MTGPTTVARAVKASDPVPFRSVRFAFDHGPRRRGAGVVGSWDVQGGEGDGCLFARGVTETCRVRRLDACFLSPLYQRQSLMRGP